MKKSVILSLAFFSSFAFADCASDVTLLLDKKYDDIKVFDAQFYLNNYPDLISAIGTNADALKAHWKNHGICEGRQASDNFYSAEYLNRYPDLRGAFGNNYAAAMRHYLDNGKAEERLGRICEPVPTSIKFSSNARTTIAFATYADGSWKQVDGDSFTLYCTDKNLNQTLQRVSFDVQPEDFQAIGDHFGVVLQMSASKNNKTGYYLGRGVNFFAARGVFREYNALLKNDLTGLSQVYEGVNNAVLNYLPSNIYPGTIMNGDAAYSVRFTVSGAGVQNGYVDYGGRRTFLSSWADNKAAHPFGASGVNFFSLCPGTDAGCSGKTSVEFKNIRIGWEREGQ